MNIDDPKLTAYALGELTGEERQAIEKELDNDPAARAFVEETAAFARLLGEEFHAETPCAELAPAQRSEVMEEARGGKVLRFPAARRLAWAAGIGAIAAALAVAAVLQRHQTPGNQPQLARQEAAPLVRPAAQSELVAVQPLKPELGMALDPDSPTVALAPTSAPYPAEAKKKNDTLADAKVAEGTPLAVTAQPLLAANEAPAPAAAAPATPVIDAAIASSAPGGTTRDGSLALKSKGSNTYTGGTTTISSGTLTLGGSTFALAKEGVGKQEAAPAPSDQLAVADKSAVAATRSLTIINGMVIATATPASKDLAGSNTYTGTVTLGGVALGLTSDPTTHTTSGIAIGADASLKGAYTYTGAISAGSTTVQSGTPPLGGSSVATANEADDVGKFEIAPAPSEQLAAANKTRADALWAVSKGWQNPVRKYGSMKSKVIDARRDYAYERQAPYFGDVNTESYAASPENPFQEVAQNPLSTFSIDVDTASYSNVRRFLKSGQRPPPAAVRIEELVNYFHYDYPQPKGDAPFSVNVESAQCPWEPEHRLVRIGLKGREIAEAARPASNLIFLMDVSGSMEDENKLPLLKASMHALVEKLGENDKVAIVTYAGSTGVALPSTRGDQKERIFKVLDSLKADGSTNGAGGIQLAYKTAVENFIPEGTNRVILATDGDFNVGTTSESELVKLIEEERKSGVFLTVLGVGEGNLKDSMMKKLASHGNGNYAYIDSLREGRKVLVKQLGGTLVTIAKDVKIQVEFNPQKVGAYRLVGYESRMLAKEDFNNDKKDAGEIGAGHTVTALYEVVPAGVTVPGSVDPLKYQPEKSAAPAAKVEGSASNEMLTVKLRYKKPTEETSQLIEQPVKDSDAAIEKSSPDFRFAAAVAEFGMLLRGSNQSGGANWDHIYKLAADAEGRDEGGYRAEFLELVEKARGRE